MRKPLFFFLFALLLGLIGIISIPLPSPLFKRDFATVVKDNSGQILSMRIADDEQWRFPIAKTLPEKYVSSLLLYEDEFFYSHPGINPVSLGKAIITNIQEGQIKRGGSTISMQVLRMAYGNRPRTYSQKFIEILGSLKLELLYSKEEILSAYASNAPFGGNIIGLNAASWLYFGRDSKDLSWAEASLLAVLPNDPSSVFPGRNRKELLRKRNFLLDKLYAKGIINQEQNYLAKEEGLPMGKISFPSLSPHLLQKTINDGHKGTELTTSIDLRLQKELNRILESSVRDLRKNQIHNAASLIIDVKNNQVLAYCGNVKSGELHSENVDIIQARRSPGSLLKPFLYAAAIDEGLILPNQLLPDIPMIYRGFAPKNFDKKFRGAIPADQALTGSLNVPFVHLLRKYGYEKMHSDLKKIGMHSLDKAAAHYGLSLILGGAESTLWELTSMYAAMARVYNNSESGSVKNIYREGDYSEPKVISNSDSSDIDSPSEAIFSFEAIQHTLNALKKLERPIEEEGWKYFSSAQNISWKTGTSYGFKDAWAIACTEDYAVGVWVGNADGEGRPGLVGVKAAAPIMFQVFNILSSDAGFDSEFGMGLQTCKASGMKAGKLCYETEFTSLPKRLHDAPICEYHQKIHLDESLLYRVNSNCYPITKMKDSSWFILPNVQEWYYKRYHPEYLSVPALFSECTSSELKNIKLIYPNNFSKVHIPIEQDGNKGKVVFEASHRNQNGKIFWHLNEEYIGLTESIHQMPIMANKGKYTLTLIDESGEELSQRFEVVN